MSKIVVSLSRTFAVFAVIVLSSLPSFAARTLAVAEKGDDSVTFALGGADGFDYKIFVAHGATDGGDDKYAWDSFEYVCEAPSDASSVTWQVPAALRDGRKLRFFLMQTVGVNCAKELVFVRSSSQQWIDTQFQPTTRTVVDFRFGDPVYAASTAFFGQNWTGKRYLFNQQSNSFYFHADSTNFGLAPTAGMDYRFRVDDAERVEIRYGEGFSQRKLFAPSNCRQVASNSKLAIFGCNDGNNKSTFSFYRMKIALAGTDNKSALQRDFVPAMDANGVAGLYDNVNNVFYKSKTATPLIAGGERPAERFGRVLDSTPTLAFHRTMKVVSRTLDTITLAFGNPCGKALSLCVAYGTTDGEYRKTAWESFEEIATVAADATELTAELPAALARSGKKFRLFLMDVSDLPYSSELASITSTGTQYVPLGYTPGDDTSVDFLFNVATYEAEKIFFGQSWNGHNYLFNEQSNMFKFHGGGVTVGSPVSNSTDYRFKFDSACNSVLTKRDGSYKLEATCANGTRAVQIFDMVLFGSVFGERGSKIRFDGMRIWDKGLLARDLVPVVANGKAALFDRETGVVLANAASTDFTRGADAGARTGWVQAETETMEASADATVRAVWTGADDGATFADAANWSCFDVNGDAVANAVPALSATEISLEADADWTAEDLIALRSGITVDLKGHSLKAKASSLANKISLADSAAAKGSISLDIAGGATCALSDVFASFSSGIALVKRGAGTLAIDMGISPASLTVVAGWAKLDGGRFPNGTSVVVKNGATFDVNGKSDICLLYTIEGTGPDGLGALRSSTGSFDLNVPQMAGIILTGDATHYCPSGHFGLINSGYAATTLELNGHTLTVDLKNGYGFWLANTQGTSGGTVYVKSGIPYPYNTASSIKNVNFILDGSNCIFRMPGGGPKIEMGDVLLKNGASFEEGRNNSYMKSLTVLDNCTVPSSAVSWIYVANRVVVSNETSDITIYPPVTGWNTYPKLFKYGAGTLTLANNHTDQRFDRGVEIFGGTVVMDSTASTKNYHVAISSQPAPVTIHAGGTLDMRKCTQPMKLSSLEVEEGGTILHTAANALSFPNAVTFTKPWTFAFAGTVGFSNTVTFDLAEFFAGGDAPQAGETVTVVSAGSIVGNSASAKVVVTGCPYDFDVQVTATSIVLRTKTAAEAANAPVKIWAVGGNCVAGDASGAFSFRTALAQGLAAEGWNIEMTGWRTVNARLPNGFTAANGSWSGHTGAKDLALKTSATRAGLLEGLETHAMTANHPDFTILVCGDTDVADGVQDETVLANLKEAVSRIKSALPMTTVLVSTIPGAGSDLNAAITSWCAGETDVEAVDLASVMSAAPTASECNTAADALKAKIKTLATPAGKNTPSAWTPALVLLGATNNVPAAYLDGFVHVRTLEPGAAQDYAKDVNAVDYTYAPAVQKKLIAKAGYYVDLVNAETGDHFALWVDMDAPGSNLDDITMPVTVAQKKQQAVTRLHVWSNTRAVTQVPADDDTVSGYIEFNPNNYSGNETATEGAIAEVWSATTYGFNDTFSSDGGHACFQIMRKFSDVEAFPGGEILFAWNHWGVGTGANAMGIGTFADYGEFGYTTSKSLDRTFTYGSSGDVVKIGASAFSVRRIEFWAKYSADDRTAWADCAWSGATDCTFATAGNWLEGETAATSLANKTLLLPEGESVEFTYVGWDPVNLSSATFVLDGTASFPEVGGFRFRTMTVGATGRLVYDPVKFTFRLAMPPVFESGAKIALPAKYAAYTKGRFLLMTWDAQSLDMDSAALNAIFDASSASGTDVKVYAENLEGGGGRLWLDLDYSGAKTPLNVLCVGDSITQGNDSTYGNWRTTLMKFLAAKGFAPVAKGFWTVQSHDICGAEMPVEWTSHAGISGQRIATVGAGLTLDQIENTLDQAGDVDFILVKLGTNDIYGGGNTAAVIFPYWKELANKILAQKPHAKLVAGAVVDIAFNATKDEQVLAFNTAVSNAIANAEFPAKRAYFADLYTPCYRYDGEGNYITGSFQSSTDLHPDWPGEYKMAVTYGEAVLAALADDPSFECGAAETGLPTTTGAENNVPAAFRAGFEKARVLDVAASFARGDIMPRGSEPPYSYVSASAPTANLSRVGYYIEIKRKDTALSDYHDLVRYIWVSMDAFGGRTIDDAGIPTKTENQCRAKRLRIYTNMPGIENTAADAADVEGWIEFWPNSYDGKASGISGAPAHKWTYDWDDTRTTGNYGSMQVHRVLQGERNPAQVLFAFNHWSPSSDYCFGIGNFSHQTVGSVDWTFTGDPSKNVSETMALPAYEIAKIEIWTAGGETSDPDAPFAIDTAVETDGSVTVSAPLGDYGYALPGATATLEWSSDSTFASVAGSAVAQVGDDGRAVASVTGLEAGSVWYFRFKGEGSSGTATTTAASAPFEYSAGVWRPATASDTWTDAAWKKNGAGANVTLDPQWMAKFDGGETVKPEAVQISTAVAAKEILVDSSENYKFAGAGAVTSERLVKSGSGTLEIGAATLAGTQDFVIEGGTVKLGDNAAVGAVGNGAGTVTVKNGGQFDLNYNDKTSGEGRARAQVTSRKKFVIEGAGPDGKGALVSTCDNTVFGSPFDEIVLSGDATIGGTSRLDMRGNSKNSITGPDDATLTIKLRAPNGIGLQSLGPISVGHLVIAEDGELGVESVSTLTIPQGIDLYGYLGMYNAHGAWNVGGIRVHGTDAVIFNGNGSLPVDTSVTVDEGAVLSVGHATSGTATVTFPNAITNKGEIAVVAGLADMSGELFNFGNPLIRRGSGTTSSDAHYIFSKVHGSSRMRLEKSNTYLSGRSKWDDDSSLDVTLASSGGLVIGWNSDGYGFPKFGKNKLSVNVESGCTGSIYFHGNLSDSFDGLRITGPLGKFHAQGPTSAPVDIAAKDLYIESADQFIVGTGSGRGEITVDGDGSEIHAGLLYIGSQENNNYLGSLTVKDGIFGIGANGIMTSRLKPRRPMFTMENGTLKADANFALQNYGMNLPFGSPAKGGKVDFDLNGKNVKWQTSLTGGSDVTIKGAGSFSPERPGIQGIPTGKWKVESTGSVDLRNAAGFPGGLELGENANVAIDIAGTNMVEMVAWTWHDNAWDIMDPLYKNGSAASSHLASSLTFANRPASVISDTKRSNGLGLNYIGQFYVSAEQAGTWQFAWKAKSHCGIYIDSTALGNQGKGKGNISSIELTEGWHNFMISFYTDATGFNFGPATDSGDLAATASVWFKLGSGGSWPNDYTVFDSTTVPMRMRQTTAAKTSVRWRNYNATYGNSGSLYLTADEHLYNGKDEIVNTLQTMQTLNKTGVNAPLGGRCARFDGWFYVAPGKAGGWKFTGKFDDFVALFVDGRRIFASPASCTEASGTITLMEGWHKFDIRTADNSSSGNKTAGSGGMLTDSHGNSAAIVFSANGAATDAFDERYVPIAYFAGDAQKFERPGLEDVTLGAGSTLANDAREGGFCPVYGTLKGSGSLSGAFRFLGDGSKWEIKGGGDYGERLSPADVSALSDKHGFLAGLAKMEVAFTNVPPRLYEYRICDAGNATAEDLADIDLKVFDDKGDASENWTLQISRGNLVIGRPYRGFQLNIR